MNNATPRLIPSVRAFVTELDATGWAIVPAELLDAVLREAPALGSGRVFTVRPTPENSYIVSTVKFPGAHTYPHVSRGVNL